MVTELERGRLDHAVDHCHRQLTRVVRLCQRHRRLATHCRQWWLQRHPIHGHHFRAADERGGGRSEERRVGKECRFRLSVDDLKKNGKGRGSVPLGGNGRVVDKKVGLSASPPRKLTCGLAFRTTRSSWSPNWNVADSTTLSTTVIVS